MAPALEADAAPASEVSPGVAATGGAGFHGLVLPISSIDELFPTADRLDPHEVGSDTAALAVMNSPLGSVLLQARRRWACNGRVDESAEAALKTFEAGCDLHGGCAFMEESADIRPAEMSATFTRELPESSPVGSALRRIRLRRAYGAVDVDLAPDGDMCDRGVTVNSDAPNLDSPLDSSLRQLRRLHYFAGEGAAAKLRQSLAAAQGVQLVEEGHVEVPHPQHVHGSKGLLHSLDDVATGPRPCQKEGLALDTQEVLPGTAGAGVLQVASPQRRRRKA
eukprot:CAMPEP_0170571332 /NCGR_PEP_ID=MMETSP0224-20130122/1617_1 /TAXON_ID=285029 /ORGANISM="Togula jolla, Strain CCCM 725" /LENGTH=278 /DNA_ID=CAMNT_0010893729 /DNA_START=48 /DNA_END=884 /DNA_ORIENTATION=+